MNQPVAAPRPRISTTPRIFIPYGDGYTCEIRWSLSERLGGTISGYRNNPRAQMIPITEAYEYDFTEWGCFPADVAQKMMVTCVFDENHKGDELAFPVKEICAWFTENRERLAESNWR